VQAAAAALFAGIGLAAVAARKVVDQVDSGGESDYENSDIEFIGGGRHTRKQRL